MYISVIIPISERHDDLKKIYLNHKSELKDIVENYEFIFVINEGFEKAFNALKELKTEHQDIKIIKLSRNFGESAALSVGFEKARGDYIITLYPYVQVEASGIRNVVEKLKEGYDMVVTRRYPRIDSILNRIQTYSFHWFVKTLIGISYRDMSNGLRGMHIRVAKEINLYGDLHRFIPVLAQMKGFKIIEIDVKQSKEEASVRIYKPGVYIRRLFDIFIIFFLFKFTKKPLRFFGFIGMSFFTSGFLLSLYLSIQRIIGDSALANRPLLILGILGMVLGIQIASIGLLGEIIIFTHARETKDYQIEKILE